MGNEVLRIQEVDKFIESFSQNQNGVLQDLWFRFSALRKGECGKHAYHVARISYLIGRRMKMTSRELADLSVSALFHDVGKLAIDEDVLLKPSPLNEDEYYYIQKHVQASRCILSQTTLFSEIIKNILFHHEAVNGKGYPFRLTSSQIPIGSKIIAVADVYDAISANRSYNNGGSVDMALWELREKRGKKFAPQVVDCFCSLLENKTEQV